MIRKLITAAAVAAVALAPAAAQASVKPSATPACGHNCADLSSLELGTQQILNAYVAGDTGVTPAHGGQKVNLHFADDSRPNADFTGGEIGQVSQFCSTPTQVGLLSATSVACLHYSGDQLYEADWSPFGNQSDLCAGLAVPGVAGNVRLETCGKNASTLWVVDSANAHFTSGHIYTPLINASDASFSHPLVLTVNAGSKAPQDQLSASPENLLTGGFVANSQMFTLTGGPAV